MDNINASDAKQSVIDLKQTLTPETWNEYHACFEVVQMLKAKLADVGWHMSNRDAHDVMKLALKLMCLREEDTEREERLNIEWLDKLFYYSCGRKYDEGMLDVDEFNKLLVECGPTSHILDTGFKYPTRTDNGYSWCDIRPHWVKYQKPGGTSNDK